MASKYGTNKPHFSAFEDKELARQAGKKGAAKTNQLRRERKAEEKALMSSLETALVSDDIAEIRRVAAELGLKRVVAIVADKNTTDKRLVAQLSQWLYEIEHGKASQKTETSGTQTFNFVLSSKLQEAIDGDGYQEALPAA